MRKIKKITFLVLLLLFLASPSVYPNEHFPCYKIQELKEQNYSCIDGALQELIGEGYQNCKTGRVCNGEYCCGSAPNLYCCQQPIYSSSTNQNQVTINFIGISDENSNIKELIERYIGLSVGRENIGYKSLREKTADQNLRIKALYDEAYGYKQLAVIRREFLGVPKEELARKASGQVETSVGTTSAQATTTETTGVQQLEQILIEESIEAYKERMNGLIIRSNVLVSNDYKYTARNVIKLKFFNGKWYWGEGDDYPEESVSSIIRASNPAEELASSLKSASFSEGIDLIAKFATSKQHKILVVKDDGTFVGYTEFEDNNLRDLIREAIKTTRARYSDTIESYELKVYNNNVFFDDVVYFVFKEGTWQYKIKRDNEFSPNGDIIGNSGVRDIRQRPPSDFHEALIRDVIASNYTGGIKIIATEVNKENSYVIIKATGGDVKLPRDNENHISKDELGAESNKLN